MKKKNDSLTIRVNTITKNQLEEIATSHSRTLSDVSVVVLEDFLLKYHEAPILLNDLYDQRNSLNPDEVQE